MRLTDLTKKHKNKPVSLQTTPSPAGRSPQRGRGGEGVSDITDEPKFHFFHRLPHSLLGYVCNLKFPPLRSGGGAGRGCENRVAPAFRTIALALTASLLGACGSVPDTYHSLRPEISITPTRQGTPTALRYTELPPYYDSEYLVWYDEHGRITRDKSQHWTYPFSENLRDVLRQAIAAETGNSRLYTYPLAENNRPEVLLDLQIRELIADLPHQRFLISAQWQVSHAGSDAAPTNHEYQQQLPLPQSDPDSIVAATAQAINQLAAAIARTL